MNTQEQIIKRLCSECGKPIDHDRHPELCAFCWMKKNDPKTRRRHEKYLERQRLMRELDMPPNAAWQEFAYMGDFFNKKWAGYSVELCGMLVGRRPIPGEVWPYFGIGQGWITQLWQQRARFGDSRVFAEIRYHPERGLTYAIKGAIAEASKRELWIAKQGIYALSHISRLANAGRPQNSGVLKEENKEEALQLIIEIGRSIYQKEGKVSKGAIANQCEGQFGINDERTVYRVVTEYCHRDWKTDILPIIKKL